MKNWEELYCIDILKEMIEDVRKTREYQNIKKFFENDEVFNKGGAYEKSICVLYNQFDNAFTNGIKQNNINETEKHELVMFFLLSTLALHDDIVYKDLRKRYKENNNER